MWKCNKCSEELEDQFDSCWKCGTGKDGTASVFSEGSDRTSSLESHQQYWNPSSLEAKFQEKFKCCKCEHREARIKRISTTGSGFSKLIDLQHNAFIAVSCENCGHTEFFNPDILEGKKYFGTILDLLFG